jgi:hypothetical protein
MTEGRRGGGSGVWLKRTDGEKRAYLWIRVHDMSGSKCQVRMCWRWPGRRRRCRGDNKHALKRDT